ncbi:SEC14-like protein 1 isoform X2 [Homalodisca vitripennis]|uniref:SEC14-like protein 1 isoform X2 n=1 Tax=Homalodisca vitripennis TaxID=197043 RepID=UPI001EEA448E|nr:SEC14-like protein 1 isoform X2 [Homalodisca vitripennis]
MVQNYQSPVRVYKYPFELVMKAYERRFPTCKLIPVVLACDITSDTTSADGAVRVTERRCKLNVDAPFLIKKIIGVDHVFFIQKNVLNLRTRTLEIEAYNESFSNRVVVLEKCRYFVHPENSEWTCFEQNASVDINFFFGFESSIEKLAMKQYGDNIAKGKEIIEHFMDELRTEGITSVPRWVRPAHLPPESPTGRPNGAVADSSSPTQAINGSHSENVMSNGSGDVSSAVESMSLCSKPNRRNSGQQSSVECQYQLDTDYIQRYLGELTPMQESRLILLRKWVSQLQKGKVPSDTMLLRFLRARDFNVEKARGMLSESLTWRKKHAVDRIIAEYQVPQVVTDYFPGGWHHSDKEGQPLYLLRLGQMDVKGLLKTIGEDGLLKLTLHVCEEGLRLTDEATRTCGHPISTWCLLVDLEGLNMRHLWRPGIRALLRIIEIVEANYPETLGRVLIIRAPRVFPILWTLVSTFIDDTTRSKFLFYGGNDYQGQGGISHYIPDEYIPDFLGGQCKTKVLEGGLVPKGLYLTEGELEREGGHMTDDTIYHSVSLSKGQVHEVLVTVEDSGCVITWDFDVMRQDVMFTVLRTDKLLSKDLSPGSQDGEHRSVVDKGWVEGQDYHRVEQPLTCHDGESIQGSHVTCETGTYVLQWRFSGPHLDLLDSITSSHRAQVMYYYEVLSSADYKGSLSSLQSGNSLSNSCPSR